MSEWHTGTVAANGIDIRYHRTGGDKPSLVLAHGFSDNGLCWTRLARVLAATFDTIMVDARNHGGSARAVAGEGDLADDLAGVIDALSLERPALIGHSMGAATVADLAGRHAQMVSRIVLEDPPWMSAAEEERDSDAKARREGFREYLETMSRMSEKQIIESGRKLNPTWHEDEFPAWAASKKQVSDEAMQGVRLGDWKATARSIQCPTLLVYGDKQRGGIVDDVVAKEVSVVNGLIAAHHIADAGHNIRREKFDEFCRVVLAFLVDD